MFAYSCRCIQTLGQLYWSPWTTKVCGTWGLQYGKGSTLGNNSISGSGLRFTALPMNMTFLLMLYVAAKPLDPISRTDYLFKVFSVFIFLLPVMRVWLQDKTLKGRENRGLLLCLSHKLRWIFLCLYNYVSILKVWIHFILKVCCILDQKELKKSWPKIHACSEKTKK